MPPTYSLTPRELAERSAAAIAAAIKEGLELVRDGHDRWASRYTCIKQRSEGRQKRFYVERLGFVQGLVSTQNFHTAEEAALYLARVLARHQLEIPAHLRRSRAHGTMTAEEALAAARAAGLPLDRAVFAAAYGNQHKTGYRHIMTKKNGSFAVNAFSTEYVREPDWPSSFDTAEEAALHLAMYNAKVDSATAAPVASSTTAAPVASSTTAAPVASAATVTTSTSSNASQATAAVSSGGTTTTTTAPASPSRKRLRGVENLSASTPLIGDSDATERMCSICFGSLGASSWGFAAAAGTTERPRDEATPHACCDKRYHADCLTAWVLTERSQKKEPSCPCCRSFLHGRLQRHFFISSSS